MIEDKEFDANNKLYIQPLHIKCHQNDVDAVDTLLKSGCKTELRAAATYPWRPLTCISNPTRFEKKIISNPQIFIEDLLYGGTPLFWTTSPQVIKLFHKAKKNLDPVNFAKRTPLFVAVQTERLDCVVALLMCGARADVTDISGNTALHLASVTENLHVVMALVAFHAPIDALNNSGQSARHLASTCQSRSSGACVWLLHAVGAKRCSPEAVGCAVACRWDGDFDGQPPAWLSVRTPPSELDILREKDAQKAPVTPEKGLRVLTLDGGGVRGLVLIQLLLNLERKLNGKNILDVFDFVCGTSTGGILAIGLATGRTLEEMRLIYMNIKDDVFCGEPPYHESLEHVLQSMLGENTMGDIKKPMLAVTALQLDCKPPQLKLFRNYPSGEVILSGAYKPPESPGDWTSLPPSEQLQWKAARATSAAPTYFEVFGNFADGGLSANNPTQVAIDDLKSINIALRGRGRATEAKEATIVVSLGTGTLPPEQVDPAQFNAFCPPRMLKTTKPDLEGSYHVARLAIDLVTSADGTIDASLIAIEGLRALFRLSPPLSVKIALDETDEHRLIQMLFETEMYLHQKKDTMAALASLLVQGRE